ncbi:hypothetical protein FHQ26_05520 [Testudinibacter sp. TR-2022]|uniref:hypothetical protein n=1 Tax=Testudinibacter sp. TR-2022 TaxID=2585029 RepID=UPI001117C2C9|nr:hypothetical protein [Testudinibacter sp. TR-2022]TNH05707.1 hypothetical protein FHQ22_00195 [Pasteurellaceae bacterium Phil31]TNH10188.1 hypothetical protein FHQ26_05520 [Testudinibacter sp. TR-2022]TNH11847.1 hypothetical protein FHQ25_02025 [Testudinibacter sp. TR-2022]TNH12435.1 hypothetical protein FIA56_09815 [Testudinibacter sp. TR-2022]TNH19388.1 hypothetical protein FHQ23_03205 [Testudinibacter sp. TR-2022]
MSVVHLFQAKFVKLGVLSLFISLLTACFNLEKSRRNLEGSASSTIEVPINYIDAYVNVKHYYQMCHVPSYRALGASYIETALDRENGVGKIELLGGHFALELIRFINKSENSAAIELFITRSFLHSEDGNRNLREERLENIKIISQRQFDVCM